MNIQPYLFFEGRCEQAIEFYRKVLDAKVETLMRYSDSPQPNSPGMLPPGSENKIMHSSLRIGDSVVMASDGSCGGAPSFQGFYLSLGTADNAEAERMFAALADDGTVHQPLIETFFSSRFGMVADRFGVQWMVLVPQSKPA